MELGVGLVRLGPRTTQARRRVLDAITRLGEGFTAEKLCQVMPGVGRATIYRTLKLMVEAGVVCKVALADGAPRYRPSRAVHHHHLVCVGCGETQDFDRCTVDDLLQQLRGLTDFALVGHRIEIYGLCSNCQRSDPSARASRMEG